MEFHYKALGEDGYIEVFHNDAMFLRVKQINYLNTFYTFYKDSKTIFKSRLTHFFWRKVKILQQNFPEQILGIETPGWSESNLVYHNTILAIRKNKSFKKRMWLLYKNGLELGYIEWTKAISVGGEYKFCINDEDEILNTYFLILYATSIPEYT